VYNDSKGRNICSKHEVPSSNSSTIQITIRRNIKEEEEVQEQEEEEK
jgi:hypothetical protein